MIYLLFLLSPVWAEEAAHSAAAHGGAHAIPWGMIGMQAFNFGLLLLFLGFILRKTVKAHFEHRAQEYRELVGRAEAAKVEAERGHREISDRLNKLESGAEQGLVQARSEAEELKKRMLGEAQSLAEKLAIEAKQTAKLEVEKAKAELRRELLQTSLKTSNENLKKNLGSTEQVRLQKEFAEKIQVVGG